MNGRYESTAAADSPLPQSDIDLEKTVERARARVCTLGYGELYLTGQRIGDDVLNPGWTQYERALYSTYDVADHLTEGQNILGLWLGNGWFNKNRRDWTGFGSPRAILQLNIEYTDGTTRTVSTDSTWQASSSPITSNDIYDGERYDARMEEPGWAQSGFEATYRFEVASVLAEDADLALVVERPEPFEVAVNGEPVAFDDWWLDRDLRHVKIGGLMAEGENRITLATDSVSIEHALAPAYLVGDHLGDISDPIRPRLTPALSPNIGDLTTQEYPFYTGTVMYRGAVDVPDWEAIDISIEADGLLTTATIDGTDVGIVGERSAPRDLSISRWDS